MYNSYVPTTTCVVRRADVVYMVDVVYVANVERVVDSVRVVHVVCVDAWPHTFFGRMVDMRPPGFIYFHHLGGLWWSDSARLTISQHEL